MVSKSGEVYTVEFPFSNISQTKKRPALLIGNISGENKIFCQISTKNKLTKKYQVNLNQKDTKGNIKFDSFINCDMIFTLHKDLIVDKIGEISNERKLEVFRLINEKILI
jgi:mRNA interferase MazF